MVKARQCLIMSLVIHALAAILAGRFVMSPAMKYRAMSPVMETSHHSDELLVDMLALESLKRYTMVREAATPSEVAEIQPQSLDFSLAKIRYEITPIMPEEEVFLPVIWTSVTQEPVLRPMNLYAKVEIMERGARKHLRTVYIGPINYVMLYRDDLIQMTQDFLLALIEKDYERAHEIAGPKYSARRLAGSGYGDMTAIISIGDPDLLRSVGMSADVTISCEMKLTFDETIGRAIVIAMPCYTTKDGWFFQDIYSTR